MDKDSKDLKERTRSLDIEKIMSSENGRRFIWRILEYCGVYQDMDFADPYQAAKQAGRRQTGLWLLGILSEEQELKVFKMMQEARNASLEEEQYYVRKEREQSGDNGADEIIGSAEQRGTEGISGEGDYFGIPRGSFPEPREDSGLGKFI